MTFDNSKTIISQRIKLFAATVLFLVYIGLTYAAKMIKFPVLGMNDTTLTLILVAVYLIIAFIPMILNYQYVFFSDDSDKIVFRYFSAGIIGGKKNSVEIDKRTFSGYKTESRFFGLIKSITLFQRFKEGVAKYPPVYISALPQKDVDKILKSLNIYSSPA